MIAWKPAGLVGIETVNEPGAMTWSDLVRSDVEAVRATGPVLTSLLILGLMRLPRQATD